MRKITSIFALLVVFVTSCLNENELQKESIFKADVLNYLDQFKESINDEGDQKIDELIGALNFRKVTSYAPKGIDEFLIIDISSLNDFEEKEKLSAIFFIDHGTIVRSSILALTNHNKAEELIISFFNTAIPKNYSGKISIYNILQNIEFFSILENGQLRVNGNINGNKTRAGKTNACIDWYLITTFYNTEGGRRTEESYLFTTCDCEEQNSRMGRVTCGEGGTGGATPGGGSPSFPTNPQHGDEYDYMHPDGKRVFYKYNSEIYTWEILFVALPEATVQSHPQTYPYLLTDGPTHGLAVLGPDNFLYVFNGATGRWVGEIMVEVRRPSDRDIIENIINYLKCFNKNAGAELTIYVDEPSPGTGNSYDKSNVGHAFLSITQQLGNEMITRTVGFYPLTYANPLQPEINGVLVNDSGHFYDVSLTLSIDSNQLSSILDAIYQNSMNMYNLNSSNCTNFVVNACSSGGISLPQTMGYWPLGQGLNPGDLGFDIMNMALPSNYISRGNGGGFAHSNSGNCD